MILNQGQRLTAASDWEPYQAKHRNTKSNKKQQRLPNPTNTPIILKQRQNKGTKVRTWQVGDFVGQYTFLTSINLKIRTTAYYSCGRWGGISVNYTYHPQIKLPVFAYSCITYHIGPINWSPLCTVSFTNRTLIIACYSGLSHAHYNRDHQLDSATGQSFLERMVRGLEHNFK